MPGRAHALVKHPHTVSAAIGEARAHDPDRVGEITLQAQDLPVQDLPVQDQRTQNGPALPEGRPSRPVKAVEETDSGPEKIGPLRLCALTRQQHKVADLLRFVLGPQGEIVPDLRAKLPGRGVWLTPRAECLRKAIKAGTFARALKTPVKIPDGLEECIDALLRQEALGMLALGNKGGAVTTGFEKIAALHAPIAVLVQAEDGSGAEIERLWRTVYAKGVAGKAPKRILGFTKAELALSLGRETVIHAALTEHALSSAFLMRAEKWHGFGLVAAKTPLQPELNENRGSSPGQRQA